MLFPGGFTFPNFLADVFSIFIFVLWFWLLITVFGDLFRRRDVSGLGKVVWVIVLILFPYLGVFIYVISPQRGMAERPHARAQQARDSFVRWLASARPMSRGSTVEEFETRFPTRNTRLVLGSCSNRPRNLLIRDA
jgi:predicted membrane channel-forming protein YqfA (hemolysin III family)